MTSLKCPNLLIMYGSQTGQAQSISEDIHRQAEIKGHNATVMSMEKAAATVYLIT